MKLSAHRVLLLCLVFGSIHLQGQGQNLSPAARRYPKTSDIFNGMSIAKPQPGITGSPYYNKHWDKASILLFDFDEPMEPIYGRYGLFADEVELITPMGVRAMPANRINRVVFTDSITQLPITFVNVKAYDFEGTHLKGLFEVIVEGPMMMFRAHTVHLKDPDYVPTLNSGSRDFQIIKETEIFCTKDNELVKVKNKKKLLSLFGDRSSEMEAYMKENKLGTDVKDLSKVVSHYNELMAGPKKG